MQYSSRLCIFLQKQSHAETARPWLRCMTTAVETGNSLVVAALAHVAKEGGGGGRQPSSCKQPPASLSCHDDIKTTRAVLPNSFSIPASLPRPNSVTPFSLDAPGSISQRRFALLPLVLPQSHFHTAHAEGCGLHQSPEGIVHGFFFMHMGHFLLFFAAFSLNTGERFPLASMAGVGH